MLNIVAGFQSMVIFDWDPLVIPVKVFLTSEPFDKLSKDNSTEQHEVSCTGDRVSVGPEEELSAETEGMEHEDRPLSPVQEYSEEAIDTTAIPLPSIKLTCHHCSWMRCFASDRTRVQGMQQSE